MAAQRGNPDWIAGGWGETTKAVKLPVRLADRITELRDEGWSTDELLAALEDYSEIVDLLEDALELKANAGGAIKKVIREVLEIIG